MASWAGMLATPATAEPVQPDSTLKGKNVAVVDANAIINMGYAVRSLGDMLFTTEDILKEIRDGKSRQVVDQVEFTCRNPSDESIKAVSQFARKTGDLHQLSLEDLRLLALTHMLEAQEHGTAHLRTEPVQVKKFAKQTVRGSLPGWGTSGQSEEWAAIDAIEDLELAEAQEQGEEGAVGYQGAGEASQDGEQEDRSQGTPPADDQEQPESDSESWEVARRSTNAARKQNRKASRRAQREAYDAEAAEFDDDDLDHEDCSAAHTEAADLPSTSTAEAAEQPADGEAAASEQDETASLATSAPVFESNICLVTADFPMQNVCLQMGLLLVARDGVRITHLQRFVMRCEGCATVCKDTSKIFCPACGHATLCRVEVSIGQDGAEHYGVRKKHVLKGTRYALPKPRGGRNQPNPILSEDVYNAKVRKPKKKAAPAEGDDPFDGTSFGEMKKFANQPSHIAAGLAYLTTSARQNPNERASITRSNRRKR